MSDPLDRCFHPHWQVLVRLLLGISLLSIAGCGGTPTVPSKREIPGSPVVPSQTKFGVAEASETAVPEPSSTPTKTPEPLPSASPTISWRDRQPINLSMALLEASEDCLETQNLERLADEEAYSLRILVEVDDELYAPEYPPVVPLLHRIPTTQYCAAVSISPDDEQNAQFLVYETRDRHLKVLPTEFDWGNYVFVFPPPLWPVALKVERDCQEFYDHEFNVIDERGLGIGDLLSLSGYIGEGGQVPDYEDYHVITATGRCLVVMVTDPRGPEVVLYKALDGSVKSVETDF